MSYSYGFYERNRDGIRRSAREIVPLVVDLLDPRSVIDVGCGVGIWLSVFQEAGLQDILGIDGDWVDESQMDIAPENFKRVDLTEPVRLDRQFDLVVSLEVAEHLPESSAEVFVDSLTKLGPVILFSAAIPYQGGTNHVNEQWPDYWVRHFQRNDYFVIDALRRKIWKNDNVEFCYAQNVLLFARRDYLDAHSRLKHEFEQTHPAQLRLVHPRKYLDIIEWHNRFHLMAADLAALLGPNDTLILVDEDNFRSLMAAGRRILPFLEKDGQYWGTPSDNETAIAELERLRLSGASLIGFAWPAFWWLDHYTELHHYLRTTFSCVLENGRLIAFDLRS